MIGKKIKINDYKFTYGKEVMYVNVYGAFKSGKSGNKYVIYSYIDDVNKKNKLYYGSVFVRNNELVVMLSKDTKEDSVKEFTTDILSDKNEDNYEIISLKDIDSIQIIDDAPVSFDVDINKISHKWTTTPSTFALYIQPEVDSSIIGKKHSMINEVSANMQIDVQGQAIPIEFEDNLSGKIEFKILGPYSIDCKWQEKKRNGWWKRMWGDETDTITKEDSLLGNTEAIFIDNFEVKFVTDNGKINLLKDADLIYYSAENNRYINKKDDIEFKINSGMTFEQSQQMNIMNLPSISNPIMDNNVMTTFLNGVKPEHAYIDFYYNEYATPKIKLDTTIRNFSNLMDDGDLSTSTALTPHLKTWTVGNYFKDKTFYTLSASYDVKNNTSNLSLKEL